MSFVVAKTCTGLPRINGIMKNITANIGEKVSSSGLNVSIEVVVMTSLVSVLG